MKTYTATHGDFIVETSARHPAYQAYQLLHWAFVAAPILAGLDKFAMRLTDWTQYAWGPVANLFGGAHNFMRIAGVIEVFAGLLVAFKPKIGGYVVGAWLVGIIVNLILVGNFYDIALRDLGLALGAFALARLAGLFEKTRSVESDLVRG